MQARTMSSQGGDREGNLPTSGEPGPSRDHNLQPVKEMHAGPETSPAASTIPKSDGFHYAKLDREKDQIRLLHLLPGEFDDPIEGRLSVVHLGDKPDYEALSYVWGDSSFCLTITLDGCARAVTVNLWTALRRLRYTQGERVLWVDAVCIDQDDQAEKTHQVGLMRKIYKTTRRCQAWLGEFEETAIPNPTAVANINGDTTAGKRQADERSFQRQGVTMPANEAELAFKFLKNCAAMTKDGHFTTSTDNIPPGWFSVTNDMIDAMDGLISLEYWRRIWIVQEITLPRRLNLMLGTLQSDDALEQLSSESQRYQFLHLKTHQHIHCCDATFATIKLAQLSGICYNFFAQAIGFRVILAASSTSLPLGLALTNYSDRKCTDPRDKVLAILGLTPRSSQEVADYSLTKRATYSRFSRLAISDYCSLAYLIRPPELNRDSSLPSWVPDLEAACSREALVVAFILQSKGLIPRLNDLYSAARHRDLVLETSGEDELRLCGLNVDTIKCVGPAQQFDDIERVSNKFSETSTTDWYSLVRSDDSIDFARYPSGGDYTEAFLRTCTHDVWRNENDKIVRLKPEDIHNAKSRQTGGDWMDFLLSMPRFFITEKGYIGTGSELAQEGDLVYVLYGGFMPFILRKTNFSGTTGTHTYVGHAYVHGIMDGEALDMGIEEEKVVLV